MVRDELVNHFLREMRIKSGFTLEDMSDRMGVKSVARIHEWESGRLPMSRKSINRWAEACGYKLVYLFEEIPMWDKWGYLSNKKQK